MDESNTVDYGPLAQLIGIWKGDKGMDIAPEPDGTEENPYYETISYTEGGDLSNAKSQKLAVVYYRRIVTRKSTNEVFHDQTGYWLWDARENVIMHSYSIPRAVGVLAGNTYDEDNGGNDEVVLKVEAAVDNPDWGIIQSPFMRDNAKTNSYEQEVRISNGKMSYKETTMLSIYGREFEHTDENELILSAE